MVAIMVVVLLSETNGLGFAALPRIPAFLFSWGRRVFWVPSVPPAHDAPISPGRIWPDDVQGTVPRAGEGFTAPGGDPEASSGPFLSGGQIFSQRLFRIHGIGAVAGKPGGNLGYRPLHPSRATDRRFPGRKRRGHWKQCFPRGGGPCEKAAD